MAVHQEASTGQIVGNQTKVQVDPNKPSTMRIKIYSPFKVYFDEDALSISAVNNTGAFDILPKHHNFITLLDPCEVVVRTNSDERKFKIARGVMHVKADKVIVFLDV